jgi:hypothetical protein
MYFDVYVKNRGITASNSASVSLIINGVEFQRRRLPEVDPGSTAVVEFGPWGATSGPNLVAVSVDVDDEVVESNEANNVFSTTLNVNPRRVLIDEGVVGVGRASVLSVQRVCFHARWNGDGADVVGGLVYVNGTGYVTNSTGWVVLSVSSSVVGRSFWVVTGVNASGVVDFSQDVASPSIVWDRVVLTVSVRDSRVCVGSSVEFDVGGRYEFDSGVWNGSVMFNDTLTKSEVGVVSYAVVSVSDPLFNLTAFSGNAVSVVFDELVLDVRSEVVLPGRVEVSVTLKYVSDGSSVADADVTVGDVRAENVGGGRYVVSLSEWRPYGSYRVVVERGTFLEDSVVSFVVVGNAVAFSLLAAVGVVSAVFVVRYRRRRGSVG